MQYEKLADGTQLDLPKPSIDTGMGLERTAAILQGKHDNYDIDLFQNLIAASESLTGVKSEGEAKFSHRGDRRPPARLFIPHGGRGIAVQ